MEDDNLDEHEGIFNDDDVVDIILFGEVEKGGISFSFVRKDVTTKHWLLKNETTGETYKAGMAGLDNSSRPKLAKSLRDLYQRMGHEQFVSKFSGKPAPPEKTEPEYGATNKLFTQDAAEKARALIRSKLNQLRSGIDPELLQTGITLPVRGVGPLLNTLKQ